MKYKITLIFLFCAIFTVACKKGNNPAPAPDANQVIKVQVIGNWQLTDQKVTYYDKVGNAAKTETTNSTTDQKWEFLNNGLLNSDDFSGKRSYQYTINPVDGKQQLYIKGNGDDLKFDLAIINNIMSWSQEQKIDNDPKYTKIEVVYHLKKL